MNQYLSDKIKILSAIAILFVLYIHSGFHADEIEGMKLNHYVQAMISGMLGRCAVPLFYMISGYLFFRNTNSIYSVIKKIKKRVRTLLIPYVISCVFFVVFYVIVEIIPDTSKFMNNTMMLLFEKDWKTITVSVFYNSGDGSPLAFHLWFLRDLIILVLLSPVWFLLFKYLKWSWIVAVFLLNYFSVSNFPVYALFWFGFGGAFANGNISAKCNHGKVISFVLLISFLIISFLQLFYANGIWEYIQIPVIMLGVIALWGVYNYIIPSTFTLQRHTWLSKICGFTFFIYLFHEPTLNIVRKLIAFIIGKTETGYLISYLVSPWIFMIVAVIVGIILKKYVSKLYNIATGGR
ncbi:MAG: acyltransferase [Bacteroidales bacterium]|jgi:surface polysaccharide O-acyltransferase-like enzyme|nr:acyltransferase [Bacteroidales bacterium]